MPKPLQKIERPPAVVYELTTLPVMNRQCETLRKEIGEYLDYMAKANRQPAHVQLFPAQFDALHRGANARIDKLAPPPSGFYGSWHPRGAAGARRAAR